MVSQTLDQLRIDVGVFAHNEEANIAELIKGLGKQDIFAKPDISIAVHILANGCSDQTVACAQEAVSNLPASVEYAFRVHDFPAPGKSRTWNTFVHKQSNSESDLLILMDGDIRIHVPDALSRLVSAFIVRPNLHVNNSRPVKNLELINRKLGLVERMILSGGGSLNDWRKSICGQLYAIRADVARGLWMPIGLPVEDGFLRAMVLTDCLSRAEDLDRIDGEEDVWHEYESENTISGLVRHQQRIIMGSAINAMLFAVIRRDAPKFEDARALLKAAAEDDSWLARTEKRELPTWPYGYVPFSFLTKRLSGPSRSILWQRPVAFLSLIAGFTFDALVYLLATIRMAVKGAADHW